MEHTLAETINVNLREMREIGRQQNCLRNYSQPTSLSPVQREKLITFLEANNPDTQAEMASHPFKAIYGNYPALVDLKVEFGDNAPIAFLLPHLRDINEYSGVKDKMTKDMIRKCAEEIATHYYYLKISELKLFFHRLKAGKYGEFYGTVDPIKITSSIDKFVVERNAFMDAREKEERDKKRMEARKGAISYEEYKKHYSHLTIEQIKEKMEGDCKT